ncbi:MAG: fibronectin type III domain-containing protein, partial [Candidatus Nanopelagicales bacterium]
AVAPNAVRFLTATATDGENEVEWLNPSGAGYGSTMVRYRTDGFPADPADGTLLAVQTAPGAHDAVTHSGLTNGTTYTFEVRALNGAGWGPWSPPSNAVTPRDPARLAIVITGYRATGDQANRIHVDGVTTGLVGTQVRPRVKLAGETTYRTGTAVRTVADDGSFTWQRKTNKKTYVYFLGDGVRSNRVVIAARS